MNKVRVILADDHGIVREGIRHLLEGQPDMEVVGEATDGREVVVLAEKMSPDVVVMDIAMPNLNGIEAAVQILRRRPKVGVIILSMHEDEEYVVRAVSAGVKGYLLKDTAQIDMVRAVRSVAQGESFFSPAIARKLLDEFARQLQSKRQGDSYDLLTDREKEILQPLAEGKSAKEIAAALNISQYTVETHRTHIMQKLNLHSAAEIVLYSVRKKIIS